MCFVFEDLYVGIIRLSTFIFIDVQVPLFFSFLFDLLNSNKKNLSEMGKNFQTIKTLQKISQ